MPARSANLLKIGQLTTLRGQGQILALSLMQKSSTSFTFFQLGSEVVLNETPRFATRMERIESPLRCPANCNTCAGQCQSRPWLEPFSVRKCSNPSELTPLSSTAASRILCFRIRRSMRRGDRHQFFLFFLFITLKPRVA